MGRDSYRVRTAQKVSDILKSVTKEKSLVLTESEVTKPNITIDKTRIKLYPRINSTSYEIPSGDLNLEINELLNFSPFNNYIKDNILYGDDVTDFLEGQFFINGELCSPVSYNNGGVGLDKFILDSTNVYLARNSDSLPNSKCISDKTIIFESLENTRDGFINEITLPTYDTGDTILLFLDSRQISEEKYNISNGVMKFYNDIQTSVRIQVYKTSNIYDIKIFNSFISSTIGIIIGYYVTSIYPKLKVEKRSNRTYSVTYEGSKIFSSNIKIGDLKLVHLEDSIYYLKEGNIPNGDYLNCKEFSKILYKGKNKFYALDGSMEYRNWKNYKLEGVL